MKTLGCAVKCDLCGWTGNEKSVPAMLSWRGKGCPCCNAPVLTRDEIVLLWILRVLMVLLKPLEWALWWWHAIRFRRQPKGILHVDAEPMQRGEPPSMTITEDTPD